MKLDQFKEKSCKNGRDPNGWSLSELKNLCKQFKLSKCYESKQVLCKKKLII